MECSAITLTTALVQVNVIDAHNDQWQPICEDVVRIGLYYEVQSGFTRIFADDVNNSSVLNCWVSVNGNLETPSEKFLCFDDVMTRTTVGLNFLEKADCDKFSEVYIRAQALEIIAAEGGQAEVLYDFTATSNLQIDLIKGEIIRDVVPTMLDGWCRGTITRSNGPSTGLYPTTFARMDAGIESALSNLSTQGEVLNAMHHARHLSMISNSSSGEYSLQSYSITKTDGYEMRMMKYEHKGILDENQKLRTALVKCKGNALMWETTLENARQRNAKLREMLQTNVKHVEQWRSSLLYHNENASEATKRVKTLAQLSKEFTNVLQVR
eukprot:CFRG0937T1